MFLCDESVQSPINSGDKEDETVIDERVKRQRTHPQKHH
jgi:hypothetical protein